MNGGEKVLNRQETSRVSGPSKNITVHQSIYTQEIDPRANGNALAWEFATQVAS